MTVLTGAGAIEYVHSTSSERSGIDPSISFREGNVSQEHVTFSDREFRGQGSSRFAPNLRLFGGVSLLRSVTRAVLCF
jgi:hypothetical protein